VDRQVGLEETPEEYISTMVRIFRDVRRVLRDDGTVWLNLGSSYASGERSGMIDDDEPLALRDDLSPDELVYVLSELAAHVGQGDEISDPDIAV
jgi:hypothetical protein